MVNIGKCPITDFKLNNLVHGFGGGDGYNSSKAQRYLAKVDNLSETFVGFKWLEQAPKMYHTDFEPIKLTEEWLLKAGFKATPEWYRFRLELIDVHGYTQGCINAIISSDKKYVEIEDYSYIRYVHQLQNLYYALAQSELNYEAN
jgi:hypothetical protein